MNVLNRTFRFTLAAVAVAALSACGGGESDIAADDVQTVEASNTRSYSLAAAKPTRQALKLTNIGIRTKDVLARTAPKTTKVSLMDSAKQFAYDAIPSAFASSVLPKLKTGANNGFTNKVKNGKLQTLGAVLKGADGKPIKCDTSNAEVRVDKIWNIHAAKGHMMARMMVPASVDQSCNVSYKTADFVITGTGAVMELGANTLDSDQLVNVIEAGDQAFNSSQSAVLIYGSGMVRVLDVDTKATLTDLTDANLPIVTNQVGKIAYDGKFLIGYPVTRPDTILIFEKNSKRFRLAPHAGSTYGGNAVFLSDKGQFVLALGGGGDLRDVNTVTGKVASKAQGSVVHPRGEGDARAETAPPSGMFGIVGRSGDWVMSSRCVLWNMKTNEYKTLASWPNNDMNGSDDPNQYTPLAAKMEGGKAYCVNHTSSNFVRMNIADGAAVTFNTDELGYFTKAGAFTMTADSVMAEVVNTNTSDIVYLEMNFATEVAAERGVIAASTRKVVDLVEMGN